LQTGQELEVVHWVAKFVEQEYGIVAGRPTERDGKDGSGLTIDVTFDDADPPFAVEVTRLRADFEKPNSKHQRDFERRLRRFANAKGRPHWSVGVRPETSFKASLGPAVERIIDWMVAADLEELGPGTWLAKDVPMDLLDRMGNRLRGDFIRDCDHARLKGVIVVRRESANGIRVHPVVEWSDAKSLQRPFARAFRDKSAALGIAKAKCYVTMLALDVERGDTREYLAEGVKMPDFAPTIDHLWLFVRESPDGELEAVFYARRDQRRLKRLEPGELR
jgi:hypothetical protein